MVQRVAVVPRGAARPELLLLDEPRANLDPAAAELLEPLIGARAGARASSRATTRPAGWPRPTSSLGLRAGRAALPAPAAEVDAAAIGALYRMRRATTRRAAQGAAARAAHAAVGPGDGAVLVTTFVVFHFALQRDEVDGELAAGVLWVTLLFAAMLGINRLFVADREEGGFDGFLLAPVDRTALFVAKATALLAFLVARRDRRACRRSRCCCSARAVGATLAGLIAVLALADVGIAVVGTLVAALAIQTRARDLIVPLIALPLLLPVLIAAAQGTAAAAGDGGAHALASALAGWSLGAL